MTSKKTTHQGKDESIHMSFDAPLELRNAFKAKIASQGKTVREVLVSLMEEYLKRK